VQGLCQALVNYCPNPLHVMEFPLLMLFFGSLQAPPSLGKSRLMHTR